jgi:cellobiose phosphorylase
VVTQWVLGVRPEWDGLRIDPCLPPGWPGARMVRPYRGCTYDIQIERVADLPDDGQAQVRLDGTRLSSNVITPSPQPGRHHEVLVRCR